MKNKKIVKIFDFITGAGYFLGGLFMMFTAIFLKGNGAFMLLSAIIFCTFLFLRTFLPKKP